MYNQAIVENSPSHEEILNLYKDNLNWKYEDFSSNGKRLQKFSDVKFPFGNEGKWYLADLYLGEDMQFLSKDVSWATVAKRLEVRLHRLKLAATKDPNSKEAMDVLVKKLSGSGKVAIVDAHGGEGYKNNELQIWTIDGPVNYSKVVSHLNNYDLVYMTSCNGEKLKYPEADVDVIVQSDFNNFEISSLPYLVPKKQS